MTKKHDAEIQRLIDIVNTSAVNRISKPFKVEDAYKPNKKEELPRQVGITHMGGWQIRRLASLK